MKMDPIDQQKLVLNCFCWLLKQNLIKFSGSWIIASTSDNLKIHTSSITKEDFGQIETITAARDKPILRRVAKRMSDNILREIMGKPLAFTAEMNLPKHGIAWRRIIPDIQLSVLMELGDRVKFSVRVTGR